MGIDSCFYPSFRSNIENIEEIKKHISTNIKEWCNKRQFKHLGSEISKDEVISNVKKQFGKYELYVRAMTAIWKTGRGGTSENFDINISCDKKFYWINPFLLGTP